MRILIDTHVFIWAVVAPERLSPRQRSKLESRANIVYLNSVSVAEIMIKASLGKLRLDHDAVACAVRLGFELLDFLATDVVLLKDLPFHHRNPFDRMLVVQSMARNVRLMSAERRFADYGCRLPLAALQNLRRPRRARRVTKHRDARNALHFAAASSLTTRAWRTSPQPSA